MRGFISHEFGATGDLVKRVERVNIRIWISTSSAEYQIEQFPGSMGALWPDIVTATQTFFRWPGCSNARRAPFVGESFILQIAICWN